MVNRNKSVGRRVDLVVRALSVENRTNDVGEPGRPAGYRRRAEGAGTEPRSAGSSRGLLTRTIADDRYPLSQRILALKAILAKLRPEPVREPLPPPKVYRHREQPPAEGDVPGDNAP